MSELSLNSHEARVLGVLIEKALTTPDNYPLSLNAATAGCNQKSNRSPVVDWLEDEVFVALTGLLHKRVAGRVQPAGSRVEKYRHNAHEILELEDGPLAVLAELLMRGPQTLGELRTRAARMVPMPAQEDLARHLDVLESRDLARRIPPAAGSRAGRVVQTLVADLHPLDSAATAPSSSASPESPSTAAGREPAARAVLGAAPAPGLPGPPELPGLGPRVDALEDEVRRLRSALEGLAAELGASLPDGG